jgi:hypothetical protein
MTSSVVEHQHGSGLAEIDPFSFHGHTASAIRGIGGTTPNADPTYVFHTEYTRLARGRAYYHVNLPGLQAKIGTLVLRVHILPDGPGEVATMVTSLRIQLNRLADIGGVVEVSFEAFRGSTYALMGVIYGETDASATGLTITVDRLFDEAEDAASGFGDGLPTRYGRKAVKREKHLMTLAAPQLARPVSQTATPVQLSEPVFEDWCKRIEPMPADALAQWAIAYLAQVLTVYQMAESGVRGLILGPIDPAFGRWALTQGCTLTVADVLEAPELPAGVAYRRLSDLTQPAPRDLVDFDFVCSKGLGERLISSRDAAFTIEAAFSYLRPQGLSVHVVGTGTRAPGFERAELEQLALNILSLGHDLGQLRPGPLDKSQLDQPGAFGFIARRALTMT